MRGESNYGGAWVPFLFILTYSFVITSPQDHTSAYKSGGLRQIGQGFRALKSFARNC